MNEKKYYTGQGIRNGGKAEHQGASKMRSSLGRGGMGKGKASGKMRHDTPTARPGK